MPVTIKGIRYLRTPEAAERIGTSVDTIGRWCREGLIECLKTQTGRWLIEESSLEKIVQGGNQLEGCSK